MASFSNRTLRVLGDVLSGWSSLARIQHLFEDHGISLPPDAAPASRSRFGGRRRALTAQHVATLDLRTAEDAHKLLRVFDEVLTEVIKQDDDHAPSARAYVLEALRNDGFAPGRDGRLRAVAGRRVEIRLDQVADVDVLQEHLDRIDREVDTDPAGAISATKALIESTAKIVLRETGTGWPRNVKFPALVSEAQKSLGLMVGGLAPDQAGDRSLKMVLDGLYKVAIGIDELRNRYGRDHGRDATVRGLTARHARLAVHGGTAYCRFLLDTLAEGTASRRR